MPVQNLWISLLATAFLALCLSCEKKPEFVSASISPDPVPINVYDNGCRYEFMAKLENSTKDDVILEGFADEFTGIDLAGQAIKTYSDSIEYQFRGLAKWEHAGKSIKPGESLKILGGNIGGETNIIDHGTIKRTYRFKKEDGTALSATATATLTR